MSLPIYIAGGSSELGACRAMIDVVASYGGRITYDWTRDPLWGIGRSLTMAERAETAARDLAAVADARLFWLMLPREKTEGAHVELGTALAVRAFTASAAPLIGRSCSYEIVVSGPMLDSRLFPARADRIFEDHDDALAYVVERCG
jgi:hypothetical protein